MPFHIKPKQNLQPKFSFMSLIYSLIWIYALSFLPSLGVNRPLGKKRFDFKALSAMTLTIVEFVLHTAGSRYSVLTD